MEVLDKMVIESIISPGFCLRSRWTGRATIFQGIHELFIACPRLILSHEFVREFVAFKSALVNADDQLPAYDGVVIIRSKCKMLICCYSTFDKLVD